MSQRPAERGAAGCIIISAGLGHGQGSLAAEVEAIARAAHVRLIGPNCLGAVLPRARLNASFAAQMALPGDLALISQSGAIAAAMIDWGRQRGLGFSGIVSVGDQLDVDIADLLDYFALDISTRAILMYVEFRARCAKVHVGGARSSAGQAGGGRQGGAHAARRKGRQHPHGCAGRCRRRLRRRISTRRTGACIRPARVVRLCRDAWAQHAVGRPAPCNPDQWRRHRYSRDRPAGGTGWTSGRARRGRAEGPRQQSPADMVEGQSGRHHRRCGCSAL